MGSGKIRSPIEKIIPPYVTIHVGLLFMLFEISWVHYDTVGERGVHIITLFFIDPPRDGSHRFNRNGSMLFL